jgi:hypothetical protein
MGVIKGSASNNATLRSLSREEYLELNHKQAPTFSAQRAEVYDLYIRYEKLRREYEDRDGTDRISLLLKFLNTDSDLKDSIEGSLGELYVDGMKSSRLLYLWRHF